MEKYKRKFEENIDYKIIEKFLDIIFKKNNIKDVIDYIVEDPQTEDSVKRLLADEFVNISNGIKKGLVIHNR